MTTIELRDEIKQLADKCDGSDEQQAVKSVLLTLLGATYGGMEVELMNHAAQFSQAFLNAMRARLNQQRTEG